MVKPFPGAMEKPVSFRFTLVLTAVVERINIYVLKYNLVVFYVGQLGGFSNQV